MYDDETVEKTESIDSTENPPNDSNAELEAVLNASEELIRDQRRRMEILRNQVERLQTIQYGFLLLIFVIGFANAPENAELTPAVFSKTLVWFIITAIVFLSGSGIRGSLSDLFKPYSYGAIERTGKQADDLIVELRRFEDKRAQENRSIIEKNRKKRETYENILRESHILILIIFLALFSVGLPAVPIVGFSLF